MRIVDVVIVVLGLAMFGIGAGQVVTGRVLVRPGRRKRTRTLPLAFFRAYGAFYGFVGLLIIWTVVERSWSPTAVAVSSGLLSMGAVASASWAFVLYARSRS